MKIRLPWQGVVFSICTLLAANGSAAPVTFHTVSSIDSIDSALSPPFAIGDDITVEFTFDDSSLDLQPSANFGSYRGVGVRINFGGYEISSSNSRIDILNEVFNTQDSISLGVSSTDPFDTVTTDGLVNGVFAFYSFTLWLADPAGTAFSDDLLTADKFDTSLYSQSTIGMTFLDTSASSFTLKFSFSDFDTLSSGPLSVPEPSTIVLLGLGFAVLGFNNLRRRA